MTSRRFDRAVAAVPDAPGAAERGAAPGHGVARGQRRRVTPGARIPINLMYNHVLEPIFNFVQAVEQ